MRTTVVENLGVISKFSVKIAWKMMPDYVFYCTDSILSVYNTKDFIKKSIYFDRLSYVVDVTKQFVYYVPQSGTKIVGGPTGLKVSEQVDALTSDAIVTGAGKIEDIKLDEAAQILYYSDSEEGTITAFDLNARRGRVIYSSLKAPKELALDLSDR